MSTARLGRSGRQAPFPALTFEALPHPRGPGPWLLRLEGPVGRATLGSLVYPHALYIPAVLCQRLGKPALCGFGRAGTNNPQTWARADLGLVGRGTPGRLFCAGSPGSRSRVFLLFPEVPGFPGVWLALYPGRLALAPSPKPSLPPKASETTAQHSGLARPQAPLMQHEDCLTPLPSFCCPSSLPPHLHTPSDFVHATAWTCLVSPPLPTFS